MRWFYNLKRAIRIVIAVAAWLPLVVFAGVISGSIGENGENMQAWQAVVVLLLLAVGVLFTVFAVIARKRETKAERDAKAAARTPSETATRSAANNARQADLRTQGKTTETSAPVQPSARVINGGIVFPFHTKAVGVTFDDCQARIQKSKVGDPLLIKHKPTDEYPESTDIINRRTRARIGRVNSDLAWELLTVFDEGFILDGIIADITGGGDDQNLGCNIEVVGESADE
jgi:hypothetical protein|nr:MAG TPA: HIRAN domain [Caudoviricetes sp.]